MIQQQGRPFSHAPSDPATGSSQGYSRKWAKAATDGEVPKLGKTKVDLPALVSWRRAVERWARQMESTMGALTATEVEDAAPHFLDRALLDQLR